MATNFKVSAQGLKTNKQTGKVVPRLTPVNDPLSTGSLAATPDFEIPEQNISAPQVEDVQADFETGAAVEKQKKSALTEKVDLAVQDREKQENLSQDDYLNELLFGPTYSELQAQEYARQGVDESQLAVDQYDTQLLSESTKLRRQIERIQSEGGGLKIGAQAEMANLERDSLAKQADIALLRLAAQDKLDFATTQANRMVNAMYERQENILSYKKEVMTRNRDLFDQAEQRQFDLALAAEERHLEHEKEQAKLLQNTKISALTQAKINQAPESVVNAIATARTPEEVLTVGGQWGVVDMLQRQNLRSQIESRTLDRNIKLLELAMQGDATAIEKLGYDPRDSGLTTDEMRVKTREATEAQEGINTVNELLANTRGMGASTGVLQNAALSGFFQGGKEGGVGGLTRFSPVIGNIQGAVQTAQDKQNFLSGISFLVNDTTFQEVINMKQSGVTFGNMTEGERTAAGRAANRLNAAVEVDEAGVVTRINASDDQTAEWLADLGVAYTERQNGIYVDMFLSPEEQKQIRN